MNRSQLAFVGTGLVVGTLAFTLLTSSPARAVAAPPDKDVTVINTPAQPVPVTGSVVVSGSTTVAGAVDAAQSGYWFVGASQDGAWNVGIDPSHNAVSIASQPSFFYDSGFSGINDGDTLDLGPFDLSDLQQARIILRAVNGDMHCEVRINTSSFAISFDQFTAAGEGGPETKTVVYDVPPRSITLRLTESGPGGSNYHVMIIGR